LIIQAFEIDENGLIIKYARQGNTNNNAHWAAGVHKIRERG
jgi:hypothetical protein